MADQRIILNLGGYEFVVAKRIGHDWRDFCDGVVKNSDGKPKDLGDLLNDFRYSESGGKGVRMALAMYYEHDPIGMVDPILRAVDGQPSAATGEPGSLEDHMRRIEALKSQLKMCRSQRKSISRFAAESDMLRFRWKMISFVLSVGIITAYALRIVGTYMGW